MLFESLSKSPVLDGDNYHFISETHELTASLDQLLAIKAWINSSSTSEVLSFPETGTQELQSFTIQSMKGSIGGYLLESDVATIYSDKEYFDNFLKGF